MSVSNNGNQTILFAYKTPAKGREFSKSNRDVILPGIYSGGTLSKIDNSTISISTFSAWFNVDTDKAVHITTSTAISLTCSSATPILYMTFTWADSVANYIDFAFRAVGSPAATNEILIGQIGFTGSDVNGTFDYTSRTTGLIDSSRNIYALNEIKFDNLNDVSLTKYTTNILRTPNILSVGTKLGVGLYAPQYQIELYDDTNGGTIALSKDSGTDRGYIRFGRNNSSSFQTVAHISGISDSASINNGIIRFYATTSGGVLTEKVRIAGDTGTSIFDNLKVDTINEYTLNAGVTIEGITVKDSYVAEPLGINIAPVSGTNLQVHQLDSGASVARFTNSTTTTAAGRGTEFGIDASEQAKIWNYENTDVIIGTNNIEKLRIINSGSIKHSYDSNSYVTHTIADNSLYTIAVAETSGYIILSPGSSTPYVNAYVSGATAQLSAVSSDASKYIYLSHNNTNGLISTGGGTPGNIYSDRSFAIGSAYFPSVLSIIDTDKTFTANHFGNVSILSSDSVATNKGGSLTFGGKYNTTNYSSFGVIKGASESGTEAGYLSLMTSAAGSFPAERMRISSIGIITLSNTTEATSSTAAALVSSGGIAATGNNWIGGYFRSGKGRWPTGGLYSTSISGNTIFDTLAPYIPNTNDEILINGSIYLNGMTTLLYIVAKAIRYDSTNIEMFTLKFVSSSGIGQYDPIFITDGSSTDYSVCLAW